ncbi:MAG TPA: LysR family transcriptional regulator [Pseudolabrys sp.]|jgi:DNA-binding transcriptional LysR family regulator
MNLTLRQLEILVAAADAKTFSAAAAAIGISQPSLSESIRRIEHELGISLFERTTRSLKLTEAGARATGIARELVQDFRRAMEQLATGMSQGRIAIAALPSIACAVMPQALTQFASIHPGVTVELHDVQHERAIALLRDGFADIAVTLKPAPDKDLQFDDVAFDTAHLVCRRDHPLAKKKTVRWRDLAGQPFIGITRISSVRRLTDAAFAQDGTPVLPRFEVEQVPSAIALVEAGLGVTALPSLTFAMFRGRGLSMRPLGDPVMRRHVGFVTRTRRVLPGFAADLRRLIGAEIEGQLKVSSH